MSARAPESLSLSLPFSGETAISRHCSHQGALKASEGAGRQCLALLTLYRQQGPLTDMEAADLMGVERSTINARRRELRLRGLVSAKGSKTNGRSGVRNTTWGLAGLKDDVTAA